jgi:hypothetical protein
MTLAQAMDKIDELKEEIRQLKDIITPNKNFVVFGYSPTQSVILRTVAAGRGVPISYERVLMAVVGPGEDRSNHWLAVHVCHINNRMTRCNNRKLTRYFKIENVFNTGYKMPKEDCEAIIAETKQCQKKPFLQQHVGSRVSYGSTTRDMAGC